MSKGPKGRYPKVGVQRYVSIGDVHRFITHDVQMLQASREDAGTYQCYLFSGNSSNSVQHTSEVIFHFCFRGLVHLGEKAGAKQDKTRSVVVAQLAEQSLPIPEVRGSNAVISEFLLLTFMYCQLY